MFLSNTQNPNPISKITIYCTKYTQNAKHAGKFRNTNKQYIFLFHIPNKFLNSNFVFFVIFVTLGFLDFCIFILHAVAT